MNLDILQDELWKDLKEIIIFGYGKQGKKVLKNLQKDFSVIVIVDNDVKKSGMNEDGISIVSFEQAAELLKKYKIIVTAAEFHYKQIKTQLQELGLIENRDFVMYQAFIMEWYYKYKQKIYMLKTDIIATSACSLKCKNCSLFIPYWKKNVSFSVEQLKSDADSYFKCVDFVLDMNIIGGEPFLYKDLDKILCYYGEHYRHKIGHFGIITNGTVTPKDSTIAVLKKYDIAVAISDYSEIVGYKEQADRLCEVLQNNEVEYSRNTEIQWYDFGFPYPRYCYQKEEIKAHMENCNTICHNLNENRIWYCANAWAAYKSGLYPTAIEGGAYVDLDEIDENSLESRKRILDCCCGNMEGYVNFCKVCGGYGADNNNKVITAEQLIE